jgi:lysylphosphatidylglycerol synthetase-like protein (DUF2156 family)
VKVLVYALEVVVAATIFIVWFMVRRLLWRRVVGTSFGAKYGWVIRVAAVVVLVLIILLTFLRET